MRTLLHIILICIFGFHAKAAYALNVNDVRFGVYPDKTRVVINLSEPVDFRAFAMTGPDRIVIDLPAFAWNVGSVKKIARITAMRHGPLEPGVSRIIFETPQSVGIQAAFIAPRDQDKPDRLVIDFGPAPTNTKISDRTFGNLLAQPQAPQPASASTQTWAPPENVEPPPSKSPAPKGKKPLIVIDAGHGGDDPGAIGNGNIREKHITLALAKELRKQLLDTGNYDVKLTRETDKFIILKERVGIARRAGADLFISIHADSIDKPKIQGASVYTLSNKASDEQSAKLAARENKADLIAGIDLSIEDKEVADILVDLARRDTMNQSRYFAGKIVNSFNGSDVNLLERPQRSAGFAVLKAPDIPSVLVEAGFVSNSQEASLLNSEAYRKKLAKALRKGIDAYFEQVRKTQRL